MQRLSFQNSFPRDFKYFFLECYKDKYTSEHFVEKFKRAALKKSTFVIFIFTIPFGAFSVSVIFFHLVGQKLWPKLEIHPNKSLESFSCKYGDMYIHPYFKILSNQFLLKLFAIFTEILCWKTDICRIKFEGSFTYFPQNTL